MDLGLVVAFLVPVLLLALIIGTGVHVLRAVVRHREGPAGGSRPGAAADTAEDDAPPDGPPPSVPPPFAERRPVTGNPLLWVVVGVIVLTALVVAPHLVPGFVLLIPFLWLYRRHSTQRRRMAGPQERYPPEG